MKTAYVMCLVLFYTASVWAGIGEDKEDTIRRCGEPSSWRKTGNDPANTATAYYHKDEPRFDVTFFTNRLGRFVSGKVTYKIPAKKEIAEPLVSKILEINGNGQKWTVQQSDSLIFHMGHVYKRQGATANWTTLQLTITLDDFSLFCEADKKRLEAQKTKKLLDNVK